MNEVLVSLLVPVVAALASILTRAIVKYMAMKTKSEGWRQALFFLSQITEAVVTDIEETVAKNLRKDGKLTKEDAETLKQLAMQRIKSSLPSVIFEYLSSAQLENIIASYIEIAVRSLKQKKGEK